MIEFTASQIASFLNGKVEGDENVKVSAFAKIEEGKPGSLSFLSNPAYIPWIYKTQSSVVLVNSDFKAEQELNCTLVRVENAYNALAKLLQLYQQNLPQKKGISSLGVMDDTVKTGKDIYLGEFSVISKNCKLGDNVKVYPQCYIGENVTIGNNTTIYPGVRIYDDCIIGNDCTIHSGAVIGADGFGFAPQSDSNYMKIAQIGNVILEDYVEIGANTTIDRATMGSTIIKKGVKLDNLIQVAHNVIIGENTVIAAQSGIAGSSKIGRNCMIGGQVGITGHISVGDDVKIAAQAGLSSGVRNGKIIMGAPAIDHDKFIKSYIHFRNLEKIVKRIDDLEKQLKDRDQPEKAAND